MLETIKALAAKAGGWIPDALLLAGAASVAYGAGLMYAPAGFIVGGMLALAGGWLLARGG